MEEMVYQKERIVKVLHSGFYKGVPFAILNLGTHPTAYVENIIHAADYDDSSLADVDVHGGFTFCSKGYWGDKNTDGLEWLGWDYAHRYDFMGYCGPEDGTLYMLRKWTTEIILGEVHFVIDQLLDLKQKNKNKEGGDYIKLLDWLEEIGEEFPIHIHSQNPVGVENMRRIIKRNEWREI